MITTAPTTLEAARALDEISRKEPHIIDWSVPVFTFIDDDNRLMKVVKDINGDTYLKVFAEIDHYAGTC